LTSSPPFHVAANMWRRGDTLEAIQVLDRVAQLGRIGAALRQRHEHHARRVVGLGRGDREDIFFVVTQHLLVEVGGRWTLVRRERGDSDNTLGQVLAS
jgi:hypothetical protein